MRHPEPSSRVVLWPTRQKGEKPAHDFLRWLYREGHLNSRELGGRIRALDDLASGKLRPELPENGK